jgi:hypothetical protein
MWPWNQTGPIPEPLSSHPALLPLANCLSGVRRAALILEWGRDHLGGRHVLLHSVTCRADSEMDNGGYYILATKR